ncbi:MAG: T9SS type A sorting domain-containing protein [Chitinophagales bacterium]|nr:T9SS type A sorting domain-containing protein [Chitinophagales bacterium]
MNQKLIITFISTLLIVGLLFSLITKFNSHDTTQNDGLITSTSLVFPNAITCPDSMELDANEDCEAEVVVILPLSSIGCHLTSVSYTLPDGTIEVLTSPFPYSVNLGYWPEGNHVLIWDVEELCDNGMTTAATCYQNIHILDKLPPTITCPDDVSVGNDMDGRRPNRADFTYVLVGQPVATDNCTSAASIVITHDSPYSSNPEDASGDYPLGITDVCWTATDLEGNESTCCMQVIVYDNTPPEMTCPGQIEGVCSAPAPLADFDAFLAAGGTATDDIQLDSASFAFVKDSLRSETCAHQKTIWRYYSIGDNSGNRDTCYQVVLINDNIAPEARCKDVTVHIDATGMATLTADALDDGSTDNCGDPVTFSTDVELIFGCNDIAAGGKVAVVLVVTDGCGNTSTCTSIVTVEDEIPPTITCPAGREVSLDANCKLVVPDLTGDVVTQDNCIMSVVTQSPVAGTILNSSDGQHHTITFTVTDISGLVATCTMEITGKDKLGPDIVCKEPLVVSFNDFTELPAGFLIKEATDNCGGELTYTARRMGNVCGENVEDEFGPYAVFCCDDIGKEVLVIVRVADQHGNYTECMISITLQDKLPPVIIEPLPDVSISCPYVLDIDDLSIFGTFVSETETRQDIIIDDPDTFYPPNGYVGRDGVYGDNCNGVTVTSSVRNVLDAMCHTGKIYRDFVITDNGGNTATFTQTINVINPHPFDINDITWPEGEVVVIGCDASGIDPSITGAPVLNLDFCSMAGATYADMSVAHPLYCKAIRRTWTVLDWCQYDKKHPEAGGKWTFVQNIFVNNEEPPVIDPTVCKDTIICTGNGCTAINTTFTASGTDDCNPNNITWKYKVDLFNDGGVPDYSGNGATVTKTYPLGQHKMTWEATDVCGNTATCSFLFTVKDCKKPTPIAIKGLAQNLMAPGMASIKAAIFNNGSSDNCTSADKLKYSFSRDINDTLRVFNCDSVGDRRIELWVTDLAGNQAMTVTFLNVQDNHNLCDGSGRIVISGTIFSEDRVSIPDVKVVIEGGETEGAKMTNQDGQYQFDNLTMFNDYQIAPHKDENPLDGISTMDIVLIQRHILGIELLNSPYKVIAADVNGSNTVTASDLSELRKLILGVKNSFVNNTPSWRFADASYPFDDPTNPWYFKDNVLYENVALNMNTSDFIAIKTGDVNGTVSNLLQGYTETRGDRDVALKVQDKMLNKGELAEIPFAINRKMTLTGLQFSIELDGSVEFRGIEAGQLPLRQENIHHYMNKGKTYINISFDKVQGLDVEEGVVLLNMIVMPESNTSTRDVLHLNGSALSPEIYNESLETDALALRFIKPTVEQQNYLVQNKPNPFSQETVIGLYQAQAETVSVVIFDASGKMISSENLALQAGYNQITINNNQLKNRLGVFYCKIKSGEINQVLKLLRIE